MLIYIKAVYKTPEVEKNYFWPRIKINIPGGSYRELTVRILIKGKKKGKKEKIVICLCFCLRTYDIQSVRHNLPTTVL